jgi:hypothetical protein
LRPSIIGLQESRHGAAARRYRTGGMILTARAAAHDRSLGRGANRDK